MNPAPDPELLLAAIEAFLAGCRRPAALEYGENPIPLTAGCYALEIRSGRLSIEIWDETRSVSRRILSVEGHSTGVLDCVIQKFGGQASRLTFLDLDRPQTVHRTRMGRRQNFAEQFRRLLQRQFPGWEIEALSSALDLRHSFSSIYPRAKVVRGNHILAAMACPAEPDEPGLLAFALLWRQYLEAQRRTPGQTSLCLFLPEASGSLTAHRLRWLNAESLTPRLFRFNSHGSAGEVDARDLGNLYTRLASLPVPPPLVKATPPDGSERWFETIVRANLQAIDPDLLSQPVHGQVITFAAADRDLIDLLAVSSSGRLAVLELKVAEDLQLPLQALDYWMRVVWHLERNELGHLFPGCALEKRPPKLLLIAPAMTFHSSNADLFRYFSPEIEVERIGVNSDWRNNFRVVLRLTGADLPISHGGAP